MNNIKIRSVFMNIRNIQTSGWTLKFITLDVRISKNLQNSINVDHKSVPRIVSRQIALEIKIPVVLPSRDSSNLYRVSAKFKTRNSLTSC